ncbi:tRNA modification GTPase TrmE [Nitratireductor pacificus pht-3B]|uniref:tRNA modification GTPase MnmE n=2 Tax=Nitratireductor TaxID=245876 RepID=K2N457_9HYPH|nr:tRNA uridine-5-carboxymethylaminomethyl(34) synthesis GTPase MnmE [Nitratireductor pacificus]EKF19028.1 tRNA modification GTPase TrmE [Nitratireductor pacificus pht-3B]
MQMRETIFALSSGGLPAGVAIIRLSGPGVTDALAAMAGEVPPARRARLTDIRREDGALLDRGLILFFPAPHSFTGEDCGELHLHGGRAVVQAVLDLLGHRPDFRAAEAGEFTRRAFLNGKLDLTGAEALADLIAAETEAQHRFALASGDVRHQQLYAGWRRTLIRARAMIEAELDFADEEDVPGSVSGMAWREIEDLCSQMAKHADGYRDAEIIRDGFRVVILGAPNAGKSSLLNAMARRDIAIVTDEPGTTRDVLEAVLDIGGAKVIVTDTAGIRANPGRIEAMGMDRAMDRARDADLILLLEDADNPQPVAPPENARHIRVANKIDLLAGRLLPDGYDCAVSAASGEGLDALFSEIGTISGTSTRRAADLLPFRERHVRLIRAAIRHARRAADMNGLDLELRAEELRLAADALGRIAGTIDVEDLLDTIFSQFCIGK